MTVAALRLARPCRPRYAFYLAHRLTRLCIGLALVRTEGERVARRLPEPSPICLSYTDAAPMARKRPVYQGEIDVLMSYGYGAVKICGSLKCVMMTAIEVPRRGEYFEF